MPNYQSIMPNFKYDVKQILTGTPIFKDSKFEKLIREALIKPTGKITSKDMAKINQLVMQDSDVTDISGIEYCINLFFCNLSENSITNINPLKGLNKLISLDLRNNPIHNINVLGEFELKNLQSLDIEGTNVSDINSTKELINLHWLSLPETVSDITPLKELVDLKTLRLPEAVRDLQPLSSLTKLENLSMYLTPTIDFSPLIGLTNLTLQVNALIDDLRPLSCLVNLEVLRFWNSKITDLNPLSNLTNLKFLDFGNNFNCDDISPLKNLRKLEKIIIYESKVTDFSPVAHVKTVETDFPLIPVWNSFPCIENEAIINLPIKENLTSKPIFKDEIFERLIRNILNKPTDEITSADMERIKKLNISNCDLFDITGIEYCINLEELSISDNKKITDISLLSNLTNLRILKMICWNVLDIKPLSKLTGLTNLFLDTSPGLSDISPLSELTELIQLILVQSYVSDIRPLSKLTKLKKLICVQNSLSDVSPLSALPELEELWLIWTAVTDLSPVAHIKNLREYR